MPEPDTLTAKAILRRMARAYATCVSYKDTGLVRTVFIRPGRRHTTERPFKTAFVRPDHFRFEFREGRWSERIHRYIVWAEGKAVQTWWDIESRLEKPTSLAMGLAGATGVSGGSAHTVPCLLLPRRVGGRRLTDLKRPTRIEDGQVGKVHCFRIHGKFVGSPTTLWIEKDTYLVRKLYAEHQFDDFRTETTATYAPAINAEISDKLLNFKPPSRKQ